MAFNYDCFKKCVKERLRWYTWLAIGVVAIAAFLLAILTWGFSVIAALLWALGVFGGSTALALFTCYLNCSK